MHDTTMAPAIETMDTPAQIDGKDKTDVVSTHVLVEQEKVDRLRELSRRTRIAQSEYLREAVDDLLGKYERKDR